MAAKRKTAKKAGSKKDCNLENLCSFAKALSEWLVWFHDDYTKLRNAVCNVEKQAFAGTGLQSKRFCKSGGPGDDPVPPKKPPVW